MDISKLTRVFQNYPDVLAVYLFGSYAEGRERTDSDIDLAILPRNDKLRGRILDVLTDLAFNGYSNVDITFLDTNDIVLKHQAVRLNQVIYHTPEFDCGSTYSRIIREYLDFKPALAVQRAALKRRILNTETRSDSEAITKAG